MEDVRTRGESEFNVDQDRLWTDMRLEKERERAVAATKLR